MDPVDLDELVARARAGDRESFLAVVDVVHPTIRRVLASCAIHPQQVEELIQETMVSVWRNLEQYRGRQSFVNWAKTIARNHLRKELRAQRHQSSIDTLDALVIDRQLDRMEEAESLVERERQVERLHMCLMNLPDHVRMLVSSYHLDGMSVSEIGKALRRTANWVAVSLFRARKALAKCMQEAKHAS